MDLSPQAIVAIIVIGSLGLGGLGAYIFRPKKKKKS